jgi:hypothetical protein
MNKAEMMQVFATMEASMQRHGWELMRNENGNDDDRCVARAWKGAAVLQADGSGIWGCTSGVRVAVQRVSVTCDTQDESDVYLHVGVEHACEEKNGMLYTDGGLAGGVSMLLGHDVQWTEQGMQDDYYMSME